MFSLLNLYSIYFPFLNYSIKLAYYSSDLDIKFTYKWTLICYGRQLWRLIRKKKKFNYLVRILFYHWLCNTPFSALHNWHCISCLTAAVSKHSVSISYKYQLRVSQLHILNGKVVGVSTTQLIQLVIRISLIN